jgi:hypothetical protein
VIQVRVRLFTMVRDVNVQSPETMTRRGEGAVAAELIAIGYPDETTAHAAADEARRRAAGQATGQ